MRRDVLTILCICLGVALGAAQPQQIPRTIIAHPVEFRNERGPWNTCNGQVTVTLAGSEIRLEHFGRNSRLTHLVRLPSRQGDGTSQEGFTAQREGDGATMSVLIEFDALRDSDALWITFKEMTADRTVTYRVINRPQIQR